MNMGETGGGDFEGGKECRGMTLDFEEWRHVLVHGRTSRLMLGQTYRSVIKSYAALIPGWKRL